MKNITGSVARGSNFFDRETEIAELVHLVERDNVLLLAPRRAGKTSLMYRLFDESPPGWTVCYADVESAEDERAFVARLLVSLRGRFPPKVFERLGERITTLLNRIHAVGAGPVQVELVEAIGRDWQEVGAGLFALIAKSPDPTLVMIDEFPIYVRRLLRTHGEERGRLFLDWFRGLRIGDAVHQAKARFLLAGSIGLDAVVSRARMSATINDLVTFRLGPLSLEQARALLVALADGENLHLTPTMIERFLARITWPVPFHLQLLFSEVLRAHRFGGQPLTAELVDRCYEALLGPDKRKHFAHWEERLEVHGPVELGLARAVLRAAAKDAEGVGEDVLTQLRLAQGAESSLLAGLIEELCHDGYLVRDGARWRFASSLLGDWWLRWKVD